MAADKPVPAEVVGVRPALDVPSGGLGAAAEVDADFGLVQSRVGFGPTGRSGTRRAGVWKDRPRHDDASHGADAFLTFACSGYQPPSAFVLSKREMRWVV